MNLTQRPTASCSGKPATETGEDFENWRDNRAPRDHSAQAPVASGMDLPEFEVVELAG
ncbi:hypothetical protein ACWF5H_11515 [Arthrobacter sp. NPDC055138]